MDWLKRRLPRDIHEYIFYVIVIAFFVVFLLGIFLFASWMGANDESEFYMIGIIVGGFIVWFYNYTQQK